MSAHETFGWLDIEHIGALLNERHAGIDPMRVSFPQLRGLVAALPGFKEEAGHPVNERILEEIQAAWIEERRGGVKGE